MNPYSDSKSAISIAHNPVRHDRTEHVEIDSHYQRKDRRRFINRSYVPIKFQEADILTKAMSKPRFEFFVSKLVRIDIYSTA